MTFLASQTLMNLPLAFADATQAAHSSGAGGEHVLLRGYLIAWLFWLGVSLGGAALTWLHHLTGGKWGQAIRLELTAAGQTLPLLALGSIPLLMNLPALYEWARPEAVAHDALLMKKTGWLNQPFFIARTICYFALWLGLSTWVTRLRRRAQANPNFETEHGLRFYSAAGVLVYGLTVTLASIDYSMSLEPHWYSGIYGVIYLTSQALAALAFSVAVASPRSPSKDPAPFVIRDLGNLMLAFTMLWTYMSLSQFLIIWMGDLPEENVWYLHRLNGGWMWLAQALIFLGFCAPFMTLLSTPVKTNRRFIGLVAVWVLVMRWLDILWNVDPAFGSFSAGAVTSHIVVTAAVGAVWFVVFLWRRGALRNDFPYEPPVAVEGH
jgi:hypothetical protein